MSYKNNQMHFFKCFNLKKVYFIPLSLMSIAIVLSNIGESGHFVWHAWCRKSDLPLNSMPSASEVAPENGAKPTRKRKERSKEEKPLKADNANCSNILKEDKTLKDEASINNMEQDLCVKNGQEWQAANDKSVIL